MTFLVVNIIAGGRLSVKALDFGARVFILRCWCFKFSERTPKKSYLEVPTFWVSPSCCIIYSVIQYGVLGRCLKLGSFPSLMPTIYIHTKAYFGVIASVSFFTFLCEFWVSGTMYLFYIKMPCWLYTYQGTIDIELMNVMMPTYNHCLPTSNCRLPTYVLGMSPRPCFRTLIIKSSSDRDKTLFDEIRKKSILLFSPLATCRFRAGFVKDPESGTRGLRNNTWSSVRFWRESCNLHWNFTVSIEIVPSS